MLNDDVVRLPMFSGPLYRRQRYCRRSRRRTHVTGILGSSEAGCYLRLMGRASALCGVILAAGDSSRMGRDKALLPWPPQPAGAVAAGTFLSAAIALFDPFVDMVLVVVGKNERGLAPIVYGAGASLVVNPDPARGQFSDSTWHSLRHFSVNI